MCGVAEEVDERRADAHRSVVDEAADIPRHEVEEDLVAALLEQGCDRLEPEAGPSLRVDENEREGVVPGADEATRGVDVRLERAGHDLDLRPRESLSKATESFRPALVERDEERAHRELAAERTEPLLNDQQLLECERRRGVTQQGSALSPEYRHATCA
ncbi:MAG: hypothetical protein R3A52_14935 [Polyangiales bacterium]